MNNKKVTRSKTREEKRNALRNFAKFIKDVPVEEVCFDAQNKILFAVLAPAKGGRP
jgi:hypothetical protein